MSSRARNRNVARLLVLTLLLSFVPSIMIPTAEADGEGWLTGWDYRKSHEITGSNVSDVTDYQIRIVVNDTTGVDSGDTVYALNSTMQDIRFTSSDGETELDYWLKEISATPLGTNARYGTQANMGPAAEFYNNVTYYAFQGTGNHPYVGCYNHTDESITSPVQVGVNPLGAGDYHGMPALWVDSNGEIHVLFGCHGGAIEHVKSDNPEDISSWSAQADIPGTAKYPYIIKIGTDVHLFYHGTVATREFQHYRNSTDDGASWSAEEDLVDLTGIWAYYHHNEAYDPVFGVIHISWFQYYTSAPLKYKNVYHAYFNLTDRLMYSMNGTDLGATVNLAESEAHCKIFDGEHASSQFMGKIRVDENGYPHVIFHDPNVPTDKHTRWNGTAWTTPTVVGYGPNLDFEVLNTTINVYMPSGDSMYLHESTDAGLNWTTTRSIRMDTGGFSAPHIPTNYDSDFKLFMPGYETLGALKNIYALASDFSVVSSDVAGIFWVEVDTIPEDPATSTIYIYYGNDTVGTTSNGTNTFPVFDDFNRVDNAVTGGGWTEDEGGGTGDLSIETNRLRIYGDRDWFCHVERNASSLSTFIMRGRINVPTTHSGTSWRPNIWVYWDLYDWVSVGLYTHFTNPTKHTASFNKAGTNGGTSGQGGSLATWYDYRLRVTIDKVFFEFSTDDCETWTEVTGTVTARPASWDGPAELIVVGKGHSGNGGSYPNADLDNSAGAGGGSTASYGDVVLVRNYVNSEPVNGAWGAEEEAPAGGGGSDPTRGSYVVDMFDAPDLLSDGERNTRFWFQATDLDGYATIDTMEFSIQVGTTWCNFSYDTNADGSGVWTKTTEQPYIEMFCDGWGGATSNYMMYAWIQANPGTPDTYGLDVYQRVTDTSSASSGWGQIYGTPFNIVEQPEDTGSSGGPGPGPPPDGDDGAPPDEPGDPYWWTDPDNLNEMSEGDLVVLAESLGVTVTESDTKADIIQAILDQGADEGFVPFEGCGLEEEEKLALLDYLSNLTVEELRQECQDLGISYKLWRDPEPYIIIIFTVGYGCSPPDEFYDQGYFDPEDWDDDGVVNWEDPDMFDKTRIGLGARVEDINISTSLPWIQKNGYMVIILALFLAFMYSQVRKADKPGSRGESLLRPPGEGYLPGERTR